MIGECVALGTLARKSTHRRCLGDRCLRRKLVFRGARFQLFELQRQLLNQTRRALRSLPVDLALQLGDPQLLLGDQRHVFGRLGPRDHQLRGNLNGLGALNEQCLFQRVDVIGQCVAISIHGDKRIINSVICGALKSTWPIFFIWLSRRSWAAMSVADFASRSLLTYRTSEPPRSTPLHPTPKAR